MFHVQLVHKITFNHLVLGKHFCSLIFVKAILLVGIEDVTNTIQSDTSPYLAVNKTISLLKGGLEVDSV